VFSWLTAARRGWLYRILVAVGLLLVMYGIVTADQAAAWVGLVCAFCNITPAAHTPTN